MFTSYHIIWLIICVVLISASLIILKKYKISLDRFLGFCCFGAVMAEIVKVFSVIKFVPLAGKETFTPYIEMTDVPLHLCSFQIILIFYTKFSKNKKLKQLFLSFMYPTCTMGAFLAILLPSIFPDSVLPQQAFTKLHPYEYFLYHALLIVLGIYILISGQANIKPKNYLTTILMLLCCAFLSLYLNSIFSIPVYENGELLHIEHLPNFFFTFLTPINLPLTKIWHWYIYLGVIVALGFLLVALMYLPVFIKAKKKRQNENIINKDCDILLTK